MSRTPLSFYSSYYVDTKVDPAAVTNYGGIFPYLDLMLLALNLTGGNCVDDLVKLDGDAGIGLYMGQIARAVGAENRPLNQVQGREAVIGTSRR